MCTKDIIKSLMKQRGITQGEMTEMLGMKSQAGVSQALARDMKLSMLLRFIEVMNCEVLVRDPATGEEYKITE